MKEVIQKKARAKCHLAVFFIRFHLVNTNTKINHASMFGVPPTTCGYELRNAAPLPEAVLEWMEASIDTLACRE